MQLPMSFEAARLRACSEWRYLRRALFALTAYRTEAVPRAAVDPWWRLYYNHEWFSRLTAPQAAAVVAHETWHLLRFHAARAAASGVTSVTHGLWNEAADIEIHEEDKLVKILMSIDGFTPVQYSNYDPPLTPRSVAERWYQELKDRTPPGLIEFLESFIGGSGADGIARPRDQAPPTKYGVPGVTRDKADAIVRHVARDLLESSRSRGEDPGGLEIWAREVLDPVVDWRDALAGSFQQVMSMTAGEMFWTYQRMSRRQAPDPRIVLPGFVGHTSRLAVLIDTSGSMLDKLAQCRAELTELITSLASACRRPDVEVYTCDVAVSEAQRVWSGADVKLIGGGGTDLCNGFAAIAASHAVKKLDAAICLTDAVTPWPSSFPMPVITVVFGDEETPPWLAEWPHRLVRVP